MSRADMPVVLSAVVDSFGAKATPFLISWTKGDAPHGPGDAGEIIVHGVKSANVAAAVLRAAGYLVRKDLTLEYGVAR